MSHVDEGTLHAYLDGELPSAERATIETHLEQCGECRAALAEARALLERASALLGATRPTERPAPPFEQLRRFPKRAPWHVRTSFAWAASLALALGVGYLLRGPTAQLAAPDTQQPSAAAPSIVAMNEPPTAVAERKSTGRAQTRGVRRATPAPAPSGPADELGRAREKVARAPNTVAEGERRDVAAAATPAQRATDTLLQPRLSDARLNAVVVSGQTALARAEQDRAPTAEPNLFIDGAAVHPSIAKMWPAVDRQIAKAVLGDEPVGLAGLPVRSFRRGPGPEGTIVVEQPLDASTMIQIFQRPAISASGNESRSYMMRTLLLARYVGRLRVEIAAPVSMDSLNRLLNQVRPLP